MEIGIEGLIIIILILIGIYFVHDYYTNEGLVLVKSDIDNHEYKVQPIDESISEDDAKDAANLMAQLKSKMLILVEHLRKTWGANDERIQMLNKNFDIDRVQEGRHDIPGVTSYSVNKGEKVVMCLRNRDNKLVDINTLFYVYAHEFTHMICKEYNHTPLFWKIFKEVLEEAINIGIYVRQDFENNPVSYCGMQITSSPLD